MIKTCQKCKKEFKIVKAEKKFLDKMGIPDPNHCPKCRQERRMNLRNKFEFYKYACAKCNKDMITTYTQDSCHIVYCLDCYKDFRANVDLTKV